MLDAKKPWLSVYGDRLSGEPLGGSLTEFLAAVEKYRDNTALTRGGRRSLYGELLDLTETSPPRSTKPEYGRATVWE